MTTQELLKKLGLDGNLPEEALLDALREKNLEYLERIDACTDEIRAAELHSTQEQIEDTILQLEGGVSLAGAKTKASPAPKASPKPVAVGQKTPTQEAQRKLFDAAQAGDGAAALALAKLYITDENYESALKWAKTAHSLKTPGVGQVLLALWGKVGNKDKLLTLCVEEIGWLTGFEQVSLCEEVYNLLRQGNISPQMAKKTSGDILALLPENSSAEDMMKEVYQQAEKKLAEIEQRRQQQEAEEAAREQAEKAAEEQARKAAAATQRQAAQAKAKQSRQHFWQKIFPKIFCVVAPPLMAILVNELFWKVYRVAEAEMTPRGSSKVWMVLIAMPVLPLVAGFICVFFMWWLTSSSKKRIARAFIASDLISAAANMVGFFAFFIIDKSVHFDQIVPFALGPFQITQHNAYLLETIPVFYFLSIWGATGRVAKM